MTDSTSFRVALTPRNVARLRNGHITQLSKDQIGGGVTHTHVIKLSGLYAKKIALAQRKKVGVKIKLTQEEIEGSGLKDTLKALGRVYRTSIRPVIGPALKKGVQSAIAAALPAAAVALGQPELVAPATALAAQIAGPATNALGRLTGAYGLNNKKKFVLSSNQSNILGPYHPAMSPGIPTLPDHSLSRLLRGGSFRTN